MKPFKKQLYCRFAKNMQCFLQYPVIICSMCYLENFFGTVVRIWCNHSKRWYLIEERPYSVTIWRGVHLIGFCFVKSDTPRNPILFYSTSVHGEITRRCILLKSSYFFAILFPTKRYPSPCSIKKVMLNNVALESVVGNFHFCITIFDSLYYAWFTI